MITDKEQLQWIHDRIVEVYGESENVDFLIRMRKIIDKQDTELNLHSVSGCLDYESFANTDEAVRWVNRNKDKTLVTITSEQYGVTVYYR